VILAIAGAEILPLELSPDAGPTNMGPEFFFETRRDALMRPVTFRALMLVTALLGTGLSAAEPAPVAPAVPTPEPEEATLSRPPYLQLGTPNSMVVVWRTLGKLAAPSVRYGAEMTKLDQAVTAGAITIRVAPNVPGDLPKMHSAPDWTWQYEATISGLSTESKYFYAIYDGDKKIAGGDETYFFTTHPAPGKNKATRFWLVGDSGTGGTAQAEVYQAMVKYVADQKRPLDMYVHVGDMAYTTGKEHEFEKGYFKPYEPLLRNTVCWPSLGNHEGYTSKGASGTGPYFDVYVVPTKGEAGGVASGCEAYYSFDYGQIHFICLDSFDLDRTPAGAMAKWLKADLEKTKAAWLVAFWHHPPYTKGTHDSDVEKCEKEMRTHIMPILESSGVDIVLTGHSHIYERSMLIDGAYATPTLADKVVLDDGDGNPKGDGAYRKSPGLNPNEGDVQIVAGHGGTTLGRKGTMPVMKTVVIEHGSCIIDVDGQTLSLVMLNKLGEVRDQFSIIKDQKVTPKRVENPRQLPPYTPPPKAENKPEGKKPVAK
jgi:acid phosphatase type 7